MNRAEQHRVNADQWWISEAPHLLGEAIMEELSDYERALAAQLIRSGADDAQLGRLVRQTQHYLEASKDEALKDAELLHEEKRRVV